jgi:hypothetical protein
MAEDEFGLKVEIDLPDTTVGRDTAESIRRGDMDGMSFAFTTDIDEWDYSPARVPIRTVMKVRELYDVGPVTYPAYTDTRLPCGHSTSPSQPPSGAGNAAGAGGASPRVRVLSDRMPRPACGSPRRPCPSQ